MSIESDILSIGAKILNESIINESTAQGHYHTGRLQQSLSFTIKEGEAIILAAEIVYWGDILNKGVSAEAASMKQFPFLVKFFQLRGYAEKEAKDFAAATIKTWQKEGMSTAASARFSKTGQRQGFIQAGIEKAAPKANQAIMQGYDREVQKVFNKIKSGII